MENAVEFTVKDKTGIITLNRPERKNAINQALLTGLYEKIEEIAQNDEIRVGVITGNGNAFCSGIDLKALEQKENMFDPRGDSKGMVEIFKSCRKPLIGAVNGHAITGGFEIALNCDFLIASENAVFRDTHALVGIHPGWGMTQLFQQAVGRRKAKQISMTCEPVKADKALLWGLVNEVVPPEKLMERTLEIASMTADVNQGIMLAMKTLCESRDFLLTEKAFEKEESEFKKFIKSFS